MTVARPRFLMISVILVIAASFLLFAVATLTLRSGNGTTNYGVTVDRWPAVREELDAAGRRAGFAVLYIRAIPDGGRLTQVRTAEDANGTAVELTYVREGETLLLRQEQRPWTVEDAEGTLIALGGSGGGGAALRDLPTGETRLRWLQGPMVVTMTAHTDDAWGLGTLLGLIAVVY